MQKKNVFIAIASIAAFSISYVALASPKSEDIKSDANQFVKTIEASPEAFQETAEFSGFVKGEQQTNITAKINGYVVKLAKKEGDRVYKGEVLAVLDGNELSAAKQSTLLSLKALDKAIQASKEYYDQKVDEAETARNQTSTGSDQKNAKEAVKSAKRLRDAEIANLQTQKASLEGSLLVTNTGISNTVIKAPFTGIITRKYTDLGSYIAPGMPLYTVATPDSMEISVFLPEIAAYNIHKDSPVTINSNTVSADGYIFSLVSSADEHSQTSIARIRFASPENASTNFRIGEHVSVTFKIGSEHQAIVIPNSAILSLYDETFVYSVENGKAQKHIVTLGVTSKEKREILSGISPDMHIVTEGKDALSDNLSVQEIYEGNKTE